MMNLGEFESALSNVEFVDLIGSVDQDSIVKAAQNLGVTLPMQYKSFIERFGGGGIGPESIIGLGGPDHLDFEFMTSLLRTKHPATFPKTFIPVRSDGFGNYDCIDLESVDEAGENAIAEWSHEGGPGRRLADDFFSWLDVVMALVYEGQ